MVEDKKLVICSKAATCCVNGKVCCHGELHVYQEIWRNPHEDIITHCKGACSTDVTARCVSLAEYQIRLKQNGNKVSNM